MKYGRHQTEASRFILERGRAVGNLASRASPVKKDAPVKVEQKKVYLGKAAKVRVR